LRAITFQKHYGGKIPQGVLRTVVPAPDAWITALERFGTMSFGEVAQSAIGFARDGFRVRPRLLTACGRAGRAWTPRYPGHRSPPVPARVR